MDTNLAIDLSIRSVSPKAKSTVTYDTNDHVPVVRPIPRPPWAIMWYQSLWSVNQHHVNSNATPHVAYPATRCLSSSRVTSENLKTIQPFQASAGVITINPRKSSCKENLEDFTVTTNDSISQIENTENRTDFDETRTFSCSKNLASVATVVDVACCDGPVTFERISNPNFALTVEHTETTMNDDIVVKPMEPLRHLTLKTYMCIYCNQSFKSLFCYQKHKKRHLNPVSVDITATHAPSKTVIPEKKAKTRDLNVQFFPCKKCGCKFPSYYFVHKHRKVCH